MSGFSSLLPERERPLGPLGGAAHCRHHSVVPGRLYQAPYDPDPGEPDSFEPAYLPYCAEIPVSACEQFQFPPLKPEPEPQEMEAEYLLMTHELFRFLLNQTGLEAEETLGNEIGRVGLEPQPSLESRFDPGLPPEWP